jgi:hypothetical protein
VISRVDRPRATTDSLPGRCQLDSYTSAVVGNTQSPPTKSRSYLTIVNPRPGRTRMRGQEGELSFWATRRTLCSISHDGPSGQLPERLQLSDAREPLALLGRPPRATPPGYRTLVTHILVRGDKLVDSDTRLRRDSYPAALRCLLDERDSLTVYLRLPREHGTRVRHSNFIERPSGRSAAGSRSSAACPASTPASSWCGRCSTAPRPGGAGPPTTPAGLRLLQDLRRSLHDPPTQLPTTESGCSHRNQLGANRFCRHHLESQSQ